MRRGLGMVNKSAQLWGVVKNKLCKKCKRKLIKKTREDPSYFSRVAQDTGVVCDDCAKVITEHFSDLYDGDMERAKNDM